MKKPLYIFRINCSTPPNKQMPFLSMFLQTMNYFQSIYFSTGPSSPCTQEGLPFGCSVSEVSVDNEFEKDIKYTPHWLLDRCKLLCRRRAFKMQDSPRFQIYYFKVKINNHLSSKNILKLSSIFIKSNHRQYYQLYSNFKKIYHVK